MNYKVHYDRLIDRARTRSLSGYSERHHVLPVCLGGKNGADNIVRLTGEEHYVAHLLLVKIYPGHMGLMGAVFLMASTSPVLKRNNKTIGWMRRKYGLAKKGFRHTPETKASIDEQNRQKVRSQEFKDNVARFHAGRKRPPETGKKISEAASARFKNPEAREKLSIARKGMNFSQSHRANIGKAKAGTKHSPETREKMRAAKLGKPKSPETIERMRVAARARASGLALKKAA